MDPLHSHNKPLQLDDLIISSASALADSSGGDAHVVHAYAETARPFAAAGKIKEEHETLVEKLDESTSLNNSSTDIMVYLIQNM